MSLSFDEAQTLAGALIQLNAILGLTLIWTETRLQQRDKEQAGNQRKREPTSQKRTSGNSGPATMSAQIQKEWFLFVIFLHSITWSIFALAFPRTFSVDISVGISIIWLQMSMGRIIRTIVVSGSIDKILFRLVLATSWTPLILVIPTIRVGSK